MPKINKLLLLISFFYIPIAVKGWGMIGHRVIGKIAYAYLSPKAKLAVGRILGKETLALSSTWGDFIRSDTSYTYLSRWHYINFPGGLDSISFMESLKNDTAIDAYTRIKFCVQELKKKNLLEKEQKLYLRMLVHVLGDIHMPFHTGRAEDKGGNKIDVEWMHQSTNMHRLWDEQLINFEQLSYSEYSEAINFSTSLQRKQWELGGLETWLFDSYQIVEKLYAENMEGNQKLGYDYSFRHIVIINNQLLKAGIRLAYVLNTIYG